MVKVLRGAALALVFVWFAAGGVAHFTRTAFFVSIVPDWVPWPLAVVWLSGVFELVLAAALLPRRSRPLAGWGLVLLTLAVTPANVSMWLHPERWPDYPQWVLTARLVVQGILLGLIWWGTRVPAPAGAVESGAARAD